MRRFVAMALALGALTLAAAAAVPGLASAEGPEADRRGAGERLHQPAPLAVAVALGAIEGDETAYIDFHAAVFEERQGGNLRFWTEDDGYYNGAVRSVTIDGQHVRASGAGPLWQPDGTRVPVRFTIDLNGGSNRVTITVEGRDLEYTLEGTIDGFVHIGPRP